MIAFDLLQEAITATRDREGPAAAARLCDEKVRGLEDIRAMARDPSTMMGHTLDMLGLDLDQVDDWARALRLLSRQLRRGIA
jgi:hypothetical protein